MNTMEKNEKAAHGEMPEGAEWLELDVTATRDSQMPLQTAL